MVKAVCFDFFQTLVDGVVEDDEDRRLFSSLGYEHCLDVIHHWIDPTQHACEGGQLAHHAPDAWPTGREQFVAWQRVLRARVLQEWQVDEAHVATLLDAADIRARRQALVPLPGVVAGLHQLHRRGVRLGICSNWDWDLDEAVERSGLPPVFGAIVSSAQVGRPKPHTEIFLRALRQLGVDPGEAVFVGDDWAKDVAGALDAGFGQVVHVQRPEGRRAPSPASPVSPVLPDPPGPVLVAGSAGEAMQVVVDLAG
jgi:HAD superfamily hydrolase (TIGR01509 family)